MVKQRRIRNKFKMTHQRAIKEKLCLRINHCQKDDWGGILSARSLMSAVSGWLKVMPQRIYCTALHSTLEYCEC